MRSRCLPWLCLLALLVGCSDAATPKPPPQPGPRAPGAPALLRDAKRPGEILVKADASPVTHGPFSFDGRYRVRFAQYAPENPKIDFAGQTTFVATLGPARPGPGAKQIRLFRDAARSGERTLELTGRHTVEVSFGDFPYVLRFTPTP